MILLKQLIVNYCSFLKIKSMINDRKQDILLTLAKMADLYKNKAVKIINYK